MESAIRFAYNRLKEGMSSKETYRLLREKFPHLPTRYIPSAIIKAGSIKEHGKVVLVVGNFSVSFVRITYKGRKEKN